MRRMRVRTHTINGVRFEIEESTEIDGICDYEGRCLSILRGNSVKALASLLEEGMHAMDIPDRYIHRPKDELEIGESVSRVDDLAKLAWRLGWRRINE